MPSLTTTLGDLELEVYYSAHTDGDGSRPDWLEVEISGYEVTLKDEAGNRSWRMDFAEWPDSFALYARLMPASARALGRQWSRVDWPTRKEVLAHCEPLCVEAERERRANAKAERQSDE